MRDPGWMLVAAALAGCYEPQTVDCGNGYLCPKGTACAAEGFCGEPSLVQACFDDTTQAVAGDFTPCDITTPEDGVCLDGICTECTPALARCRFDEWTAVGSPLTNDLDAVSVASDRSAFAGGADRVLLEWNGRAWERSSSFPAPAQVNGGIISIYAVRPDDIYVVTSGDQLWHFDGASWNDDRQKLPMMTDTLQSIAGTAADNVYAVGFSGTIVRFDGGQWRLLGSAPGPTFLAAGAYAGTAFAVGESGYIYTSDGMTASGGQPLDMEIQTASLQSVTVHSTGAIVVGRQVNGATRPTIAHFDGAQWTWALFDGLTTLQLDTVWAADARTAFAAGQDGKILRVGSDEITWGVMSDLGVGLHALGGSPSADVFAVGAGGTIWRYSLP